MQPQVKVAPAREFGGSWRQGWIGRRGALQEVSAEIEEVLTSLSGVD